MKFLQAPRKRKTTGAAAAVTARIDPTMRPPACPPARIRRVATLAGLVAFAAMIAEGWPQAPVAPPPAQPASAASTKATGGVAEAAPGTSANTMPQTAAAMPPATPPVDIFAPRNWEPPPPPEPPGPPPKPEPPPLPFRYLGRIDEPGQPVAIFLARGSEVLVVKPGDALDSAYRVGDLQGGQLRFVYQPLHAEQFLPAGSP